jgi:hypothetical protein
MNDILRLLRKSLRPFGYDIRKRGALNLLPARGVGRAPDLDRVRRNFDYDGGGERKASSDLGGLKIVFRTCMTEKRNLKNEGRIAGAPLADTMERCFLSLVRSVNAALAQEDAPRINVIILDDHSEAPYIERLCALASQLACPWTLRTTSATGQGASLHEQFAMARADDALYYFCEDDYLHEPQAVYEMWAFYRQVFQATRRHLVIYPQEHPSLYDKFEYPAYLVLGRDRHWRSIADATHTIFTHAHVVRDYWDYFENTKFVGNRKKRHLGSERRTTNRLFSHLPAFSPIPALAVHFQSPDTLPPFFDWRPVWAANDPQALLKEEAMRGNGPRDR